MVADTSPKGAQQMSRQEINTADRKRATGFINVRACIWVQSLDAPAGLALALLHVIARHADDFGCCWCKRKTLAKEAGCCVRTVAAHLRRLEELGLIRRIGRRGDHGGRISSVLLLQGWPERAPIPPAGHPSLGSNIKEDKYDALERAFRSRKGRTLPDPGATVALQNITIEKNTTTGAEKTALLDSGFAALGSWATAENRQYLTRDVGTLEEMIATGHAFDSDILPVLRAKAATAGRVPVLRTWRYFLKPVEERSAALRNAAQRRAPRISAAENGTPDQLSGGGNRSHEPSREMRDATRRVLMRSVQTFGTVSGERGSR